MASLWQVINSLVIRHTFAAYERLKREQHIDTLFHTGKAFSVFPLRVMYLFVARPVGAVISPVQAGFSAPKKKFRSSVKRHRVRRLMVEAWRLHKHELYATIPADKQLHLFLMFTDIKLPEYMTVKDAVIKAIDKLKDLSPVLSPSANAQDRLGGGDVA